MSATHPIAAAPNPRRPVLDTGLGYLSPRPARTTCPTHHPNRDHQLRSGRMIFASPCLDPLFPGNGKPGLIMALCTNQPPFVIALALLTTPGKSQARVKHGATMRGSVGSPPQNRPPAAQGKRQGRGPCTRSFSVLVGGVSACAPVADIPPSTHCAHYASSSKGLHGWAQQSRTNGTPSRHWQQGFAGPIRAALSSRS